MLRNHFHQSPAGKEYLQKCEQKKPPEKAKNSLFVSHLCHSLFIMWEWGGMEGHEHERGKNEKIDLVKMERGKATVTPKFV